MDKKSFFQLARFFRDGMVLQRDKKIKIWGRGEAGVQVCIRFQEQEEAVITGEDGRWRLSLKELQAGGPFIMEIFHGDETIKLKDIYVGDVWLCAGQSNMELPIARVKDFYPEALKNCREPKIRVFTVPENVVFQGPAEEPISGTWLEANEKNIEGFSAFSYFFAECLWKKEKVPIGIINASKGGSPIEAWLDRDALADMPDLLTAAGRFCKEEAVTAFIERNEKEQQEWQDMVSALDAGLGELPWYKDFEEIGSYKAFEEEGSHKAFEEEGWKTISLPGWFETEDIKDFCGSLWLRKKFDVPEEMVGRPADLWLGTIVDSDKTYVNGYLVGETGYQYPPRKYKVPGAVLRKKENVLTIRVLCERGKGRLTPDKSYRLFSEEGSVDLTESGSGWEYRIGCSCRPAPEMDFIVRKPTGLYNGMLAPCQQFTVKGIVWYQGESNDRNPDTYEELLYRLICSWRKGWQEELPFIIVQLPSFSIDLPEKISGWPVIREAQKQAAHRLPFVKMTVNLDLGEWNDLHPLRKREAAYRAAEAAVLFDRGDDRPELGPVPSFIQKEKERIIVAFEPARGGLRPHGAFISDVEAAGEDGIFYEMPARLEDDRLIVECSSETAVCELRYAWCNAPKGKLISDEEGHLAAPFRIKTDLKK